MARIKIVKKDGTPTPYFWSDKEKAERTRMTVFKLAEDGTVKRMVGVHYNATRNRVEKS